LTIQPADSQFIDWATAAVLWEGDVRYDD
jgi:hypothetical protein